MTERVLQFGSAAPLVGVVTEPGQPADDRPAVLLLNSGLVHRAGPNRMYVDLARRLAAAGFLTLRFDFSGIGDSGVRSEGLAFLDSCVEEAGEAMDLLQSTFGRRRFVLGGLCSGGTAAFQAACRDLRVEGAVLINVTGHLHGGDPELGAYLRNRALRRHYFRIATSASFARKNWRKAFTGRVDYAGLLRSIGKLRLRPKRKQDGLAVDLGRLEERGAHLLHVYSEGDEGLDYAHVVLGGTLDRLSSSPRSRVELIKGANHTLTLRWAQDHVGHLILDWMEGWCSTALPLGSASDDGHAA